MLQGSQRRPRLRRSPKPLPSSHNRSEVCVCACSKMFQALPDCRFAERWGRCRRRTAGSWNLSVQLAESETASEVSFGHRKRACV